MPNVITGSFDNREELQGMLHQETPILNAEISVPKAGVVVGDYNMLGNLPSIEGVELIGDKTFEDFGLCAIMDGEIDDICVVPAVTEESEEVVDNE